MLLVDNEDCFIHTLANYARQTGAEVITYRAGFPLQMIEKLAPSLILVSPGPGRPEDFGVPELVGSPPIRHSGVRRLSGSTGHRRGIRGRTGRPGLSYAWQTIDRGHRELGIFEGLPETFRVGRYHSLFAHPQELPGCLEVTAESEDGVIMGVRHRELPMEAVQFHPESILTLEGDCGLRLIENVVAQASASRAVNS